MEAVVSTQKRKGTSSSPPLVTRLMVPRITSPFSHQEVSTSYTIWFLRPPKDREAILTLEWVE